MEAAIMDSSSDATSSSYDPGLWRVCKLEYSMQQALDQLQAGLRAAGFDAASAQPLPFPALVTHALNSCSPHWISCAIDWLDQGLPIDEMIATALGNISNNRRVSQKDCHRAFRFLKRWERAHSETDPA